MKHNKKIKNIFSLLLATIILTRINSVSAVNPKNTSLVKKSVTTSEPTPKTSKASSVVQPVPDFNTILCKVPSSTLYISNLQNGCYNIPPELQNSFICFACYAQNGGRYTLTFMTFNTSCPIKQIPIPFLELNPSKTYRYVILVLKQPSATYSGVTHKISTDLLPNLKLLPSSTPRELVPTSKYIFEYVNWGVLPSDTILQQKQLLEQQTIIARIREHIENLSIQNQNYKTKKLLILQAINRHLNEPEKAKLMELFETKIKSLEAVKQGAAAETTEEAKRKAEAEAAKKKAEEAAKESTEDPSSTKPTSATPIHTLISPTKNRVRFKQHRPPTAQRSYTLYNPLDQADQKGTCVSSPTETQSMIILPAQPPQKPTKRQALDDTFVPNPSEKKGTRAQIRGWQLASSGSTVTIEWINEMIEKGDGTGQITGVEDLKSNDDSYIAFAKGVAIDKGKGTAQIVNVNDATTTLQTLSKSFQRDKITIITLQKLL